MTEQKNGNLKQPTYQLAAYRTSRGPMMLSAGLTREQVMAYVAKSLYEFDHGLLKQLLREFTSEVVEPQAEIQQLITELTIETNESNLTANFERLTFEYIDNGKLNLNVHARKQITNEELIVFATKESMEDNNVLE